MPYFNKRHYEAIASVMQFTKPTSADTLEYYTQWAFMRNELAGVFARDNSLFKRDRFMVACEPGNNVKART